MVLLNSLLHYFHSLHLRWRFSGSSVILMVQIVVLHCISWYTLMFEYKGAKLLNSYGKEALQTEVGEDGKLHATVRKFTSFGSEMRSNNGPHSWACSTPRAFNLTSFEIYSLSLPETKLLEDQFLVVLIFALCFDGRNVKSTCMFTSVGIEEKCDGAKDVRMFVWSSSPSPVSEEVLNMIEPNPKEFGEYRRDEQFRFGNSQAINGGELLEPNLKNLGSSSTTELHPKVGAHGSIIDHLMLVSDSHVQSWLVYGVTLFIFLIGHNPRMIACTFSIGVAIVQAARTSPRSSSISIFAKEYNVHPKILNTGVIFGMLTAPTHQCRRTEKKNSRGLIRTSRGTDYPCPIANSSTDRINYHPTTVEIEKQEQNLEYMLTSTDNRE
ncbi:hypothetical protein C5167_004763 [Papaver somniferum]|uniref:Uncharacterized protein n=1 Tax=Papaver somniferum TaxID=3469 RepID=A0A4Y7JCD5_PAPSO|nr:hypothetical protein C5167_004763 [Papaver somniferum]